MTHRIRTLSIVSATALALGLGGPVARADPDPPGTSCGENKVITTIGTCADLDSSCTGYDGMIIGRVAWNGRCVFPGIDGTNPALP